MEEVLTMKSDRFFLCCFVGLCGLSCFEAALASAKSCAISKLVGAESNRSARSKPVERTLYGYSAEAGVVSVTAISSLSTRVRVVLYGETGKATFSALRVGTDFLFTIEDVTYSRPLPALPIKVLKVEKHRVFRCAGTYLIDEISKNDDGPNPKPLELEGRIEEFEDILKKEKIAW
jgi:hypothetical protein